MNVEQDKSSSRVAHLRREVAAVVSFLAEHRLLYDWRASEFYSQGLQSRIPDQWKPQLEEINGRDSLHVILAHRYDMVEGSLREFLERASRLTGIRQQQRVHSPSRGDTASGRHIASFEQLASRCPCTSCCREGDDVVELHRVTDRHVKQMKGMKPKKLHEVELFAGLVDSICDAANSSFVMDIGAGAGYVGLMLRNRCRRRILAIEGSKTCSEGAITRMSRLGRKKRSIRTQPHDNHDEEPHGDNAPEHGAVSTASSHPYKEHEEPLHCTPDIDVATCMLFYDDDDVVRKANNILVSSLERNDLPPDTPTVAIGLHCCGDLTPTTLKLFREIHTIRAAAVVGCCYHRISARGPAWADNPVYTTFPLSSTVSQLLDEHGFHLNETAMELATQCASRWSVGGGALDHNVTTITMRSVIDAVLLPVASRLAKERHGPSAEARLLLRGHSIAAAKFSSIESYLTSACTRLMLHVTQHEDEGAAYAPETEQAVLKEPFPAEVFEAHVPELTRVYGILEQEKTWLKMLLVLRLSFQPVLERLIALDRLLYVLEGSCGTDNEDVCCFAVPLFDQGISPRNVALVALKRASPSS